MCNTIVNKFLFAAICLVLDWIQSNQSGFPLKVAKKLSEIFLGPSLLQDRFWSEKIFRLLISQFYLLIDLGIKNYLTCFSSSIQKMKPIVKIIDNWKNYTKEFDLDIHSFPQKTRLFSKNNDWEFHACLVRKFESIFFSTASKHLAGLEAALDCCVQITQDFDKCFCYCGLFVEPTDGIKGPFIKKINVSILRSVLLSHVLRPQDFHYRFDFQIQEEKQVLILFSFFRSYKMMAHTSHCFYFWHSTISEPRLFRKYSK